MSIEEEFEQLLAGCDPAVHAVAHAARDLVRSVHPDAFEEVHAGWGGYLLFKQVEGAGNTVCHLSAHKKHVSLGLSQGADLPDPAGLLQGGGKHSRHLKFKTAADVARPEVRALLQAAWAAQPQPEVLQHGLDEVRRICFAMPDTSEKLSHGHPTFFVGKKSFAVFGLYSPSVAFNASFELHAQLEGDDRVFPTPYMAHGGWLSIRIDPDTDWKQVAELLAHSYQQIATPKRRATGARKSPARR